ncbi:type II secretion system protein GspG, partial [Akkermansiaceae bacterium]|nr:type II secretion system protein GspG [Akkermansiaceae bacterium]
EEAKAEEEATAAEEAKAAEEATAAEEAKAAEEATAAADMASFLGALQAYKNIGGMYPSTSQGLEALIKRPQSSPQPRDWVQALEEEFLYDPWGTKYKYEYPSSKDPSRPEIISAGPDKQLGSEDDMSSQK